MGKPRLLNDEQVAYLREIAPGKLLTEITNLLNAHYGLALTCEQIKNLKNKYKIKSGVRKGWIPPNRITTPEQDEWIKAHAHGKSGVELQAMIKDQFGIELTLEQVKAYKARKKINTGLTGRYEKGHIPLNKGKKMPPEVYEKAKHTMFKKGNRPHNWKPVGSERISVDGYIEIKVKEPRTWKLKQRVVYEQHYGKIPKGMNIVFADGNSLNVDVENLLLVSDSELARLNQHELIYKDNPEATKVGLTIAKLIGAAGKLKQKKG